MGKISNNIFTVCIIVSLLLALSSPAEAAKPEGFAGSMSPGGPNIWALDPGTGIWTGYETIQLALDNVVDGGTIFLEDTGSPTVHTESLSITRNVSFIIEGESEAGIIVEADASGPVNGMNTFTVNAAGQTITFRDMTIRNGDYGIRSGAGNVNVLHCTFYHNGWDGAGLPDPETASKQDFVDFWNTSGHVTDGGAMRIENSTGSEIAYCSVHDNDRGIRYQYGSNGNFHHNSTYSNIQSGIYLTDHGSPGGCTNCQVHDNTVYGNMNNGILALRGNNNTITTNNVYDNWNTGIHMHGPSDFTVQGNTVTNNSRYSFNAEGNDGNSDGGIAAAGSETISATNHTLEVLDNTVSGNNAGSHSDSTGLWLGSALPGDGITVTGNTFSSHELDVHVLSQAATTVVNDNSFGTDLGIKNEDTSATLNGESNWWGSADGPGPVGPGSGTGVSEYVDYSPWYTDAGMTTLEWEETVHNLTKDSWYYTIQSAIDDANPNDTIEAEAGTYDEQLLIDKALTLDGSSQAATVQPTAVPAAGAYDVKITAGNVTLQNFTFDFNGASDDRPGTGIVVSDLDGPAATNVQILDNDISTGDGSAPGNVTGSGTAIQTGKNADVSGLLVEDNAIHCDADGLGEGVYINPGPGTGITVNDNAIDGYIFSGVSIEASNVTVTNNNINSDAAQGYYGIRLIDFSGSVSFSNVSIGTVSNGNQLQNCQKGIRVGTSSDVGSTLTASINGNTITGNDIGIRARYGANITANENDISGNTTYGINNESGLILNATRNWWGDPSGPGGEGPGSGDTISINVNYSPWYNCEAMIDPNCLQWDQTVHNTTQDTWYYTIQAAIDDADPADTIQAAAGTYPEYLHITTDGLTIQGAGIDQSIIDLDGLIPYWHYAGCSSSFASRGGVLITGYGSPDEIIEGVTFTGFTVKNAGLNPPITASGTHTGADNAAMLTDSSASWTPGALVGQWVHNVSDKLISIDISGNNPIRSYGLITANTATTITATLAGGLENDWDTGDIYVVIPYEEYVDVAEDLQDDITGISIQNGKDITISYCKSINNGSGGIGGSYARCVSAHKYCEGITIDHCTSSNNPRDGINIGKYVGAVTITNNTCSNNGSPHPTDPSREYMGKGIEVSGLSSSQPISGVISNNLCANSGFEGIVLKDYSDGVTIEDNTITGSNLDQDGAGIFFYGKSSDPSNCDNHIIRNNTVTGNIRGIVAYYAQYCTIQGNTITTDSGAFALGQGGIKLDGANNMLVQNNILSNLSGIGIKVQNTWNDVESFDNSIIGNTITGAQFAGIPIWSGAHDNTFLRNTITGTTELTFWAGESYEETQADGVFIDDDAGANNVLHYNNIYANDDDGLENQVTATTVDAKYNYWGHCSGPYHDPDNLDGQGDAVSDYVDFDPWLIYPFLTSDKASCSVVGDLNGDGCVNLEDFAEFALHWLEGC